MSSTASAATQSLFTSYSRHSKLFSKVKVTVVGAGKVALACIFSLITQGVTSDVVLIGRNKDAVIGEVLDLQQGAPFIRGVHIRGGDDYEISSNSRLCIVTAGVRQRDTETRLSLMQRNADAMKEIIPELVKYSPRTVIMMVSNPVDVMTYVAWRLSGLPKSKIFGSGTSLDSSRLRVLVSQRVGVNPTNVHTWIIGEHGDSSIPVWSMATVSNVRLSTFYPDIGTDKDPENFNAMHKEVVEAAYQIIKLKGYTCWAIGLSTAALAYAVLNDMASVHAVSLSVKGMYGIKDDVFMSLPAVIDHQGIQKIVNLPLNAIELAHFIKSAQLLKETQNSLKL